MKYRSKVLFGLVIMLMMVGIIGFSYALFTTKVEKKGALNIVAGNVSCPIQSSDLINGQITLQAKEVKEITVTLTNQSIIDIHSMITYSGSSNIEVLAASSNESEIELQSVARGIMLTYTLKLKNNGTSSEVITLNGRCGLSNKDLTLNEGETKITGTYEKLSEYKDPSGASAPRLVTGMIPVKWDTEKNSWIKADTTKEWYNYNQQEWANAVTVVEHTASENGQDRADYQQAEAGTPILMDDINTMWVWIPRYEYDYVSIASYAGGTSSKPGAINIKFIDSAVVSPTEDNYKIHPAFTFGNDELTGIWYGKFETSNKEKTCTAAIGSVNTACDLNTFTPQIKPGVTSWRGIRVSTAFTVSQKIMNSYANEYGFGEGIDAHMSKNSEWGAVAYLSQSKYGKYHVDQQPVYINNCSKFTTGIAGATASAGQDSACKNTYDTAAGQKASTSGNITGVYDMSGGAVEYVMGAIKDNNTDRPIIGDSGFVASGDTNPIPNAKYYDLYTSSNPSSEDGKLSATACNGVCYGHALSEMLGWHSDKQYFVYSISPWLLRGGMYADTSYAGVFYFNARTGAASTNFSFRLVLVSVRM